MIFPQILVSVYYNRGRLHSFLLTLAIDGAVPGFKRTASGPKRQGVDMMPVDEFAFLIPLDCKTSTPLAARRKNKNFEEELAGRLG